MDFEKIVDSVPIGITIWRFEADYRKDVEPSEFRLVYSNHYASIEAQLDLFDFVGYNINDIPPNKLNYLIHPDVWMRVLIRHKDEKINSSYGDRHFNIQVIPIKNKCIACIFKDTTLERRIQERAERSLNSLKKVQDELSEHQQQRNSDRFPTRS